MVKEQFLRLRETAEATRSQDLGDGWQRQWYPCPKCGAPEAMVVDGLYGGDEEWSDITRPVVPECSSCHCKFTGTWEQRRRRNVCKSR